ncbi:MAG: hypothetical protein J6Y94_04415 [Bacteriovoracaceae bacterium]|nr:hypothetical protein [Bacteriovoracaceae bacterium]
MKTLMAGVCLGCLLLGGCHPSSSRTSSAALQHNPSLKTTPVSAAWPWKNNPDQYTPLHGPGAAPGENGNGSMEGFLDELLQNGQAELRYIIDPLDGTYKSKVTIPKNFSGLLYLSGLNITSLNDKVIYVRFNFGREMEAITLPATITRGQGITPQTDIEVVALNITGHPFENLRLYYDLYDYHDYDPAQESPITDPRHDHLYCRGLRKEHDPTIPFGQVGCQNAGDTCLYSYAKIRDNGLGYLLETPLDTYLFLNPTQTQINLSGGLEMLNDTCPQARQKCLPDHPNLASLTDLLACEGEGVTTSADELSWGMDVYFTAEGESEAHGHKYSYWGPYRPLNQNQWEISEKAVWGPKGIYNLHPKQYDGQILTYNCIDASAAPYDYRCGLHSHLFPKSGRLDLRSGVKYLGSTKDEIDRYGFIDGPQSITTKNGNGESVYIDGCNLRVSQFDAYRQEGIGSCNVTATIELLSIDPDTSKETIHASTSEIKLQIIRPSKENYEGQEVLYSAMRSCTTSQGCASDQCCYNYRCWSKDIVAQCREEVQVEGNLQVGEPCRSDFECTTLCCNSATSRCAIHINTSTEQVLCSKSPGQSCISREWCRQENVTTCFIVKTIRTATGKQECALRCYNVPTYGYCREGICISPPIPAVPYFDPSEDPETRCANAIDPPNNL